MPKNSPDTAGPYETEGTPDAELAESAASNLVEAAENSGDGAPKDYGSPEKRRGRLEAVLFLAKEPLNTRKLAQLANLVDGTDARTLSRDLNRLYDENGRAFRIEEIAGGLQLRTRPGFSSWIRRMGHVPKELRLSGPSMETLSVVAYRQPVLRADIEAIRGVACGEILRQLMDRDLVRIAGRSDELGRPFLYGTTKQFLQVFGLRSLDEMPRAGVFREALVDNTSDQSQAGHDSMVNEDPTDEGVTDVSVTVEQETDITALAIDEGPATGLVRAEDELANSILVDEVDEEDLDEDDEEELGDDEEWVYEDDEEEDDGEEADDDEADAEDDGDEDDDEEELGDDEEWVYEDDEDDEEDDDDLDDEEDDDEELGEDEEWVYEDDDEDEWEEVGDDDDEEDDDDLDDDDLDDDDEEDDLAVGEDEEADADDDDEEEEELGEDEEWVYEDDDDEEEAVVEDEEEDDDWE